MKNEEPTNKEIMNEVQGIKDSTEHLGEEVHQLAEKTDQILEAIGVFSNKVEERFERVDARFDKIEGRLDKGESRLDRIENQMVTKHYLDDKLFDLKGDLTSFIRKEDYKVGELVTVLQEKKVLDDSDVRRIRSMEPFPEK